MFAIYLIAVHSMADEVHDMFQEARRLLLARYHHATQQALINAVFMRATELSVLQAYLLYLVRRHDRLIVHSVQLQLAETS